MDSWFGNGKLYTPLKDKLGSRIHILSMLRKNSVLYDFPLETERKEVVRLNMANELAQ